MGILFAILFTAGGITTLTLSVILKTLNITEAMIGLIIPGSILFAIGLWGTVTEGVKEANREILSKKYKIKNR